MLIKITKRSSQNLALFLFLTLTSKPILLVLTLALTSGGDSGGIKGGGGLRGQGQEKLPLFLFNLRFP
jgi:hypothetical protein